MLSTSWHYVVKFVKSLLLNGMKYQRTLFIETGNPFSNQSKMKQTDRQTDKQSKIHLNWEKKYKIKWTCTMHRRCVCTWSTCVYEVLVYRKCLCTGIACVQEVLVYRKCVCTGSACVQELLVYRKCVCTGSACVQEVFVYRNCLCTGSACVQEIPLKIDCYYIEHVALPAIHKMFFSGFSPK